MKKLVGIAVFMGILFWTSDCEAQYTPQKEAKLKAEAEQAPMVFQFEPNLSEKEAERKSEMKQMRLLINSLDISENKRRRLIRDLYRTNGAKKVSKYLLVENNFEEN